MPLLHSWYFIRNQSRYFIGFVKRNIQHPAYILHDGLRLKGSEGGYLTYGIVAIVLRYIIYDFPSSFEAEVDIEIRKGYTFRIQESFEEKIVFYRVYICDCSCVGYKGTGSGSSSRSYWNTMGLCPVYVVSDNKKVCGEVHLYDDVQFILESFFQTLHLLFCRIRVSYCQTFIGEGCKILRIILVLRRNLAFWKDRTWEVNGKLASLCNFSCILNGLWKILEKLLHFLGGPEIELPLFISHSVFVCFLGLGSDTDESVMGIPVVFVYVVDIVGAYKRYSQFL